MQKTWNKVFLAKSVQLLVEEIFCKELFLNISYAVKMFLRDEKSKLHNENV